MSMNLLSYFTSNKEVFTCKLVSNPLKSGLFFTTQSFNGKVHAANLSIVLCNTRIFVFWTCHPFVSITIFKKNFEFSY